MYLSRMHIDRFGILADQDVSGISPGLVVFLGHNEAGKTTCLRFLQAMLFGYRRGNRTLDPMPARGGKVVSGGSLFLETAQAGPVILTRRPGVRGGEVSLSRAPEPTLPLLTGQAPSLGGASGFTMGSTTGTELDERDLQRLLTGLTVDVFDAIFAFTLRELMEFSALKGDSVRHALHGAAFGTGMQSPAQVLKILDDRMSVLVKRDVASASAAVNNALRDLSGVRDDLRARGPDLQRYEQLHEDLENLEVRFSILSGQRDQRSADLRKIERRLAVWQQWEEVRRVRVELAALGVSPGTAPDSSEAASYGPRHGAEGSTSGFTPNAVQRLETLLVQEEERLVSLRGHEAQQARLQAECERLSPSPVVNAMYVAVQSLREQKDHRKSEAQALVRLTQEVAAQEAEQRRTLAALGPGWPDCNGDPDGKGAAIRRFDTSVAGFDVVRRAGERLAGDEQRKDQAFQNVMRYKNDHAEAQVLFQAAAASLRDLETRYQKPTRAEGVDCEAPEGDQRAGIPDLRSAASPFPRRIRLLRRMEELVREYGVVAKEGTSIRQTAETRFPGMQLPLSACIAPSISPDISPDVSSDISSGTSPATSFIDSPGKPDASYESFSSEPLSGEQRVSLWKHVAAKGLSVFLAALLVLIGGLGIAGYAASLRDVVMAAEGGALSLLGLAVVVLHLRGAAAAAKGEAAEATALWEAIAAGAARKRRLAAAIQEIAAEAVPWFTLRSAGLESEEAVLLEGFEPLLLPQEADIAVTLHALEEDSRREQALVLLVEERGTRVRHAEQALDSATEFLEVAAAALREGRDSWQGWLADHGLSASLTPQGASDLLKVLQEYSTHQERLTALREQRADLEAGLGAFISAVLSLAQEARDAGSMEFSGFEGGSKLFVEEGPDSMQRRMLAVLHMLDSLTALVEQAARDTALRAEKEAQLASCGVAMAQAKEALDVTQNALAALLGSAGAPDAEAFRAAFARWSRIEELRSVERSVLSGITSLAAEEGAAMQDVLASLEHTTWEALEEERTTQHGALTALAEEIRAVTEERGRIKERKSALAADTGGSFLRARETALCEDLHRYSREWSVLALARQLLLDAKSRYEKEGREGVLRFAGDIFRRITNEEYSGIIASLDGDTFLALHSSGEQREPERELSQGTREQLYLALRLAYVQNHARKAEALPVIVDEILVNFDEHRARNAARVLAEFARENQVLLFTCHPWLADMLIEAGEEAAATAGPRPTAFQVRQGMITAL